MAERGRAKAPDDPVLLYGGLAIALLALVVTVWGLVDDRDSIVVLGLLVFAFGIVASRLHGPFKLGPGGLEGNLPEIRARTLSEAIARRVEVLPTDSATKSELTALLTLSALRELDYQSLLPRSLTVEAPAAVAAARASAPAVLLDAGASPEEVGMAASELADELVRDNVRVYCVNGHELEEPSDLPPEDRKPCPTCGSLARRIQARAPVRIGFGSRVRGTTANAAEPNNHQ